MSLIKSVVKPIYISTQDNILDDFYLPLLSGAKVYKRVSAYFDSNILKHYSRGIENIISRNGKIYFIFSHQLTEEDYNEIKDGYYEKATKKLDELIAFESITSEVKNLAFLIKHGYVEIKIAFTKTNGIFHDKFGLIEDETETVYFRGSNNETVASITSNFESFETTCSWEADLNEQYKISQAKKMFDSLWNNRFPGDVIVLDMPEVIKRNLISFSGEEIIISNIYKENSYVMDYKFNQLEGTNNLENKEMMCEASNFYKMYLEYHMENVEGNKHIYNKEVNYSDIKKLIDVITNYSLRIGFNLYITPRLRKHLYDSDILIEKRRHLGHAIKERHAILKEDFEKFNRIVDEEMTRDLRVSQRWDAYHFAKMIRSANFSVPGAGKTSVVLGAYAYLSSMKINEVDKIVMIGPINSFKSWELEFEACFGEKRKLNIYNHQKLKVQEYSRNFDNIVHLSKDRNLFLFNYESLDSNLEAIKRIVNNRTMLVFDEVHRIKSIYGKRSEAARSILGQAKYRVVLTGTPIPNGYQDIFNMLNILFTEEYQDFFGFNEQFLVSAKENVFNANIINNAIYPFFVRTTKEDLKIPAAEPDDVSSGYVVVNEAEEQLFKIIYANFSSNFLLLYIRLMQASNNPKLILKGLDDYERQILEFDAALSDVTLDDEDYNFINNFGMTSKFWRGIDIVKEKVKNGPVIVWAIFIDTIHSIERELVLKGIKARVITGSVLPEVRENIISEFRLGKFDVLITNPHTLGESISLHKVCHQAVYFELSFNLVHYLQSRDRIHRLGLTEEEKTEYTFLFLDNPGSVFTPIDMAIYKRLLEKEELQRQALTSNDIYILIDDLEKDIKEVLG